MRGKGGREPVVPLHPVLLEAVTAASVNTSTFVAAADTALSRAGASTGSGLFRVARALEARDDSAPTQPVPDGALRAAVMAAG